jgi:hypothetical protein
VYVNPQQRPTLGKQILDPLRGQELVSVDSNRYLSEENKRGLVCQFSIEDPSAGRYHWEHVTFFVRVDKERRLTISCLRESAVVSDLREISSLVAACQQRMLRRKAQKSKRDKVQNLKSQAVIARVKQLAREEKFDFSTDTNQRALKLYVKLSDRECAELQVPFKDFEAALPHLRGAIQSLRGFHSFGLRFNIRQLDSYSRRDWVRHESLS